MAAILIFKCTEREGVGDYIALAGGGEKNKNKNIFLASSQTTPLPAK